MTSPDVTPYIDLTLVDKDPQDIFDAALADLQTFIPEWVPREGNIEVLLLESGALEVAEAVFAINRLPGGIVQALARLFGIDPSVGTPPTADLTFTLADDFGHVIPAGTSVRLDLTGGLDPVVFSTDAPLTIASGETTGTAAATGDRYTADANGVPSGTAVTLVDAVLYVDAVALGSDVSLGEDPETSDEWIQRATGRFARLSQTLVLPRHFEEFALEDPAVLRARAFDNWDGSGGAPGDDPGYVTVAVYGDSGPLSGGDMTDMAASMAAEAASMLTVAVIAPTVTAVDVTATVHRLDGYDDATVVANVEAQLALYLNPNTWDWSATVRRFELITVISNAEGVDYVETMTTPAADVALPDVANLVDDGTIAITTTP